MPQQAMRTPEGPAHRGDAPATNYGAYGLDGEEAGLPPWCRAARALLRMGAVALAAALAAYGLFPL
jgi:hypothetical protein